MALKIGSYLFYGPYPIEKVNIRPNQTPVVIAVVSKGGAAWDPEFRLIDIDWSPDGGFRLADHPRRDQWKADPNASLQIYLLDAGKRDGFQSEADRRRVAEHIKTKFPANSIIPLDGSIS